MEGVTEAEELTESEHDEEEDTLKDSLEDLVAVALALNDGDIDSLVERLVVTEGDKVTDAEDVRVIEVVNESEEVPEGDRLGVELSVLDPETDARGDSVND